MKKTCSFILLILLFACGELHAQIFDLNKDRQPVASLDGFWRFHTGDSPEWANSNFDDSQWSLLRSDRPWNEQGYPGYDGMAWYRFRVVIPAGLDHVSLLLPPLMTSYQVYVDGKLTGSFGKMPPHGVPRIPVPAEYLLDTRNASAQREATIALRVWHWQGWSRYNGGGPRNGGGLAGESSLIDEQFHRLNDSRLLSQGGSYSLGIVTAISGTISLLMFLIRRKETEYLWFALNGLSEAAILGLTSYTFVYSSPILTRDFANESLNLIADLSFIFFLQKLLRGRRSVLFSFVILAVCSRLLFYFLFMLHFMPGIGIGNVNLANAVCALVGFVWACDLQVRRAKEGLPDARLLLAPILIGLGLNIMELMFSGAFQLGWLKERIQPFILFKRPFVFPTSYFMEILFLIVMLAILMNRFVRSRREEQRLAGEFEAARNAQSLLVPPTPPNTPGFAVESVYLPAQEVGGDFFQVLPGDDGSLLIVVGDVSGKGLKAAMTVSAVIGALRGCMFRAPADVLAYLNRVLHGQISGFATCAAASIAADGKMTIANAGHLSPYCNGAEVTIASGLPLGITADSNYEETSYNIAPGDRLTFVSDGVVEAANGKRELFGFERTEKISNQPAAAIAEAARTFGQEDDITVLTVSLASEATFAWPQAAKGGGIFGRNHED